ncbi:MAG: class I SAM-dependent methyltransferase [Anaerolineae bacterium]|nr:class I SAM-dependent methyltransferase [Anaerolineae bacterium]
MGSTTKIERQSERLRSLLRQCGEPRRILDAGCGDCADSEILCACFPNSAIVGVDFDAAALQLARMHIPSLLLMQADLNRLPLNSTFDLILIRHPDVYRRADEWRRTLANLGNFIAPTGMLLVTTYNSNEMMLVETMITHLQVVPLDIDELEPVNLHGRDKVASLFCLPVDSAVR